MSEEDLRGEADAETGGIDPETLIFLSDRGAIVFDLSGSSETRQLVPPIG